MIEKNQAEYDHWMAMARFFHVEHPPGYVADYEDWNLGAAAEHLADRASKALDTANSGVSCPRQIKAETGTE